MRKTGIDPTDSTILQCKARSKQSGKRCKRYATKGMKVCHMHGGALGSKKAQKFRRQAALRHGFYTQTSIDKRKNIIQSIKTCKEIIKSI